MAITDKIRKMFQSEHGVSLSEAFEMIQPEREATEESKENRRRSVRGYPFKDSRGNTNED